ncbi:MAG: hypothetical protein WC533_00645 [Candidatus Pacearchaeota archaeon]
MTNTNLGFRLVYCKFPEDSQKAGALLDIGIFPAYSLVGLHEDRLCKGVSDVRTKVNQRGYRSLYRAYAAFWKENCYANELDTGNCCQRIGVVNAGAGNNIIVLESTHWFGLAKLCEEVAMPFIPDKVINLFESNRAFIAREGFFIEPSKR